MNDKKIKYIVIGVVVAILVVLTILTSSCNTDKKVQDSSTNEPTSSPTVTPEVTATPESTDSTVDVSNSDAIIHFNPETDISNPHINVDTDTDAVDGSTDSTDSSESEDVYVEPTLSPDIDTSKLDKTKSITVESDDFSKVVNSVISTNDYYSNASRDLTHWNLYDLNNNFESVSDPDAYDNDGLYLATSSVQYKQSFTTATGIECKKGHLTPVQACIEINGGNITVHAVVIDENYLVNDGVFDMIYGG